MVDTPTHVPRWGSANRDRKAAAIWRTLERLGVERMEDKAWLDIGCGNGVIAATVAGRVSRFVGVDPEPWPSWEQLLQTHSNLQLLASDFDSHLLPVQEQSIDIAICNQVYEHVADPRQLIANIARVLKPGGLCYFAGPNLLWPVEPHVFWPFVHWLPRRVAHRTMSLLGSQRWSDLDAFSSSWWRLRRWFREAGLESRQVIAHRAAAALDARGAHRMARVVGQLPQRLELVLAPFSPGHVFLLRKPLGLEP